MVVVYQSIAKEGRKPKSMNDSITILLAKGGDPKDPANWRPISLLNVDYKIFTRLIDQCYIKK